MTKTIRPVARILSVGGGSKSVGGASGYKWNLQSIKQLRYSGSDPDDDNAERWQQYI